MAQKDISNNDQQCISQCILSHWSEDSQKSAERRDAEYEQCLTSCRICS